MNNGPLRHFSQEQLLLIENRETFEQLRDVALAVLTTLPRCASMVCGPISSGGLGSIEKNLERFARAVDILDARGECVFSQLPFEAPMQRIKTNEAYYRGGNHLLETFYLALFRSGYVTRLCFLPDWQSSYGTRWEHDWALELGLSRKYFKNNFESLGPNEPLFLE